MESLDEWDMDALSRTPLESARKMRSCVLQAVQRGATQAAIAAAMGTSESTLSRLINDHLDHFASMLAHAGLKVVKAERVCVDRQMYEAMSRIASKAMADGDIAQRLIWEDD